MTRPTLARRPRNQLDRRPAVATIRAPHSIEQRNRERPQWNEREASQRHRVIRSSRAITTRTDRLRTAPWTNRYRQPVLHDLDVFVRKPLQRENAIEYRERARAV